VTPVRIVKSDKICQYNKQPHDGGGGSSQNFVYNKIHHQQWAVTKIILI